MRTNTAFIILSIFLVKCWISPNKNITYEQPQKKDYFVDSLTYLLDSSFSGIIDPYFNEENGSVGLVLNKDYSNIIWLGTFANSFQMPPSEIQIDKLKDGFYLLVIITEDVQLGNSEINIFTFLINSDERTVLTTCSFLEIAGASSELGTDTLKGFRPYSFEYRWIENLKKYELTLRKFDGLNMKEYNKESCLLDIAD